MLQQTQAKTVVPYFNRFLNRFPDMASLACASEREVLRLWSGLGYYNRAKNLLRAARQIMRKHGGIFPNDFKTVHALPGVGRYTAGAVCSIAFNQPVPIVDGNIRRVLTRLNGMPERIPESHFWDQMQALLPHNKASVFNQAMMELGALICTPSNPRCPRCPIRKRCRAWKIGIQKGVLRPRAKQQVERIEMVVLIIVWDERILVSRQRNGLIPGKWGLPIETLKAGEAPQNAALRLMRRLMGGAIALRSAGQLRHAISHHRILAHIFYEKSGGYTLRPGYNRNFHWINRSNPTMFFTSSLFQKAFQACGEGMGRLVSRPDNDT